MYYFEKVFICTSAVTAKLMLFAYLAFQKNISMQKFKSAVYSNNNFITFIHFTR